MSLCFRVNNYESRHNKSNGNCSPDTAKLYLSDEEEESVPIYANVNQGVNDDNNAEISDKNTRKLDVTHYLNAKHESKVNDHSKNITKQNSSCDKVRKSDPHKDSINKKTNSMKKKKTVHKPENLHATCSTEQSSPTITNSRKGIQGNECKEEKANSIKKQGGSHRRTEKKPSEMILEQIINTHENKARESQGSEVLKPHHIRSSSRHSTVKKDSLEHQKRSSINSADRHRNTLQIKTGEKNGEIRLTKERPRSKRNEYVINYDDKNGTVTSVCKVSADQGSTKKKKSSLEKLKDFKSQNKTPEKINLRK